MIILKILEIITYAIYSWKSHPNATPFAAPLGNYLDNGRDLFSEACTCVS